MTANDNDMLEALTAWELGAILTTTIPRAGAVNRTVLFETPTGRYALRAYRHTDRRRVENEHAIIAHARRHGLPAVAPLPLPDGTTILTRDGRFYAVFPYAPGRQLDRQGLTTAEVTAMGRCLARVHRALASFPHDRVWDRSLTVNTEATLAGIERLIAAIGTRPRRGALEHQALTQLGQRRAWLLANAGAATVDLSPLRSQVIHGDYQEANLFFGGAVSAIIDWDQAYVAPRAWEVVRTLHLVFDFAPAPCRAFLDAYRAEEPLPLDDLDVAAGQYSLMRAHDLWVFEAYYLDGNERVRPFMRPGPFVPLSESWDKLRAALR